MTHPQHFEIGDTVEINNYNHPPDYGIIRSEPTTNPGTPPKGVWYLVECDAFQDGSRHLVPVSRLTLKEQR